jgi:ankyrin repeat protein
VIISHNQIEVGRVIRVQRKWIYIVLLILLLNSLIACTKKVFIWDSNRKHWSPLMLAAYNGEVDEIRNLISKGINVDEYSVEGYTPLEIAIRSENIESVKGLLDNKAEVNRIKY